MRQLHVYVLISLQDRQFYVGTTTNILRRTRQHELGQTISTRNRRPLRLLLTETFHNHQDAAHRERYFKTTKGRSMLRVVLRNTLEKIDSTCYNRHVPG